MRFLQYVNSRQKRQKNEKKKKKWHDGKQHLERGTVNGRQCPITTFSRPLELKTDDLKKKKSISRQKSLSDLTPILFTVQEAASCSATRKKKLQRSRTGWAGVERAGHRVSQPSTAFCRKGDDTTTLAATARRRLFAKNEGKCHLHLACKESHPGTGWSKRPQTLIKQKEIYCCDIFSLCLRTSQQRSAFATQRHPPPLSNSRECRGHWSG